MARSPCPHMVTTGRLHAGGLAGERAELDVAGAGDVPGGVLAGLADVEDAGRVHLPPG